MEQRVYELIDSYREQYVETLRRWVRIPSVKDEAEDGAPFGREIRRMGIWTWCRSGTGGQNHPLTP